MGMIFFSLLQEELTVMFILSRSKQICSKVGFLPNAIRRSYRLGITPKLPGKKKRLCAIAALSALPFAYSVTCLCEGVTRNDANPTQVDLFQKKIKKLYNETIGASAFVRFGRVALTVSAVIVDYKYSLWGYDSDDKEYKTMKSLCHTRSAIRFRDLCSSNGGVFIKIGQHIGSMDFMFPEEYLSVLKCFQKDAPVSPMEDIRSVIVTDFGKSIEQLFSYFDPTPIGAASLAQVHRARLRNGREVAVKVQHRVVEEHAYNDSGTIEFFVNVASKFFPEFQFQWLVDELKKNIPLELDFLNEGRNCERIGKMMPELDYLRVPRIEWEYSTKRVLMMEFCRGGAVDDVEYIQKNGLSVDDITTKLGRMYSEMVFVHGYVHCDPHPGNVLVRRNQGTGKAEIVLLDHGLYQTMPDKLRLDYCKLWQSLISADMEGMEKYGRSLGVGKYHPLLACMVSGRSWDALQTGIQKTNTSKKELDEIQDFAVRYVHVITEILNLIPREMILIFKTNDLLRGLDSRLKTKATSASFVTMARCCVRAVKNDELAKCKSTFCSMRVHLRAHLDNLRITLYQFSLTPLGSYCLMIWQKLQHIFNRDGDMLSMMKKSLKDM